MSTSQWAKVKALKHDLEKVCADKKLETRWADLMEEEAAKEAAKRETARLAQQAKRRELAEKAKAMGVEPSVLAESKTNQPSLEEKLAKVSSNSIEYDVLVPPPIRGLLHPSGLQPTELSLHLRDVSEELASACPSC